MAAPIGDEHLKSLLHLLKRNLSRNQWAHIDLARCDKVSSTPEVNLTRPKARDQTISLLRKRLGLKFDRFSS
jgi:hypothetical protein